MEQPRLMSRENEPLILPAIWAHVAITSRMLERQSWQFAGQLLAQGRN
jgi:hypothetical protein